MLNVLKNIYYIRKLIKVNEFTYIICKGNMLLLNVKEKTILGREFEIIMAIANCQKECV